MKMDRNVRIAKELVRIAKSLVAGEPDYGKLPHASKKAIDSGMLDLLKDWFKKKGVKDTLEYETLANACLDPDGYDGCTCALSRYSDYGDVVKDGIDSSIERCIKDFCKHIHKDIG